MYNEEVKNEYLNQMQLQNAKKIIFSIFNNNLGYEEYFGKDFCNFTNQEILEYFTALDSVAFESLNTKCSLLRTYTQWCIEHNLSADNINHYDSITRDNLRNCLDKTLYQSKFVSLEELREICSQFVNVSDRAVCYCIFFGIYGNGGEELRELTSSCIDINTGHIKLHNGRELDVPVWVAKELYDSCETYEYTVLRDNGEIFDARLRDTDPTVFKARDNSSSDSLRAFSKRISRRLSMLGKEAESVTMTTKRLKNSGMIYKIKKFMEENGLTVEEAYRSQETRDIFVEYRLKYPPSIGLFLERYESFLQ